MITTIWLALLKLAILLKEMTMSMSCVHPQICNDGDWCEQRANGLYMCRIPNGRYYAPIKAGVQGLLRGQVQLQGQVPLQGQVQGLRAGQFLFGDITNVRLGPKVGHIGPKVDKSGFFFRSDSVHFGSVSQNVLNLI